MARYDIEISATAEKQIRKIPQKDQPVVIRRIRNWQQNLDHRDHENYKDTMMSIAFESAIIESCTASKIDASSSS